ncbi:type II secretion system protein M [Burkholderiaceae bacterium DAT-1]|nr:type II secretion system protein M [Burkholderiaceae bacterium DAT-1]
MLSSHALYSALRARMRYLRRFADRFDNLKRRERIILTLTAVLVGSALWWGSVLEPGWKKHELLQVQIRLIEQEGIRLEEERHMLEQSAHTGPMEALLRQITDMHASNAALVNHIQTVQSAISERESVSKQLATLVGTPKGIEILGVRTLSVRPLLDAGNAPVPDARAPNIKAAGQVYRHLVEVRIRGTFADLVAWLDQVERTPLRIYWDKLNVHTTDYPLCEATITVASLSADDVWLTL